MPAKSNLSKNLIILFKDIEVILYNTTHGNYSDEKNIF